MQPFFFGDISTAEASDLLTNQPSGVFLIRFSSSQPGSYTLSRVDHQYKIVHIRIVKENDYFILDNKQYQFGQFQKVLFCMVAILCVQNCTISNWLDHHFAYEIVIIVLQT